MFLPEEETGNGEKEAEPEPYRKARGLTGSVRFTSGRQGFLHVRLCAGSALLDVFALGLERI